MLHSFCKGCDLLKIVLEANAKINLLLDVTGVKGNGYHSLFTVMQSIGLSDTVTVKTTASGEITVSCSDPEIPTDKSNIVYKCAELFFDETDIENRGVHISIEKRIPSQAGLGGGSADGAAVLVALNEIFATGLTERELCRLGGKIGADIPFCIMGGTALALDIGTVVAPLPDLRECCIVIVKPKSNVSTAEAYAALDAIDIKHPKNTEMLDALVSGDFETAMKYCANVFEQAIDVSGRVDIKDIMLKNGCFAACMSGSGSAVFGIFDHITNADECSDALEDRFDDIFVCEPKNYGVKILKEAE